MFMCLKGTHSIGTIKYNMKLEAYSYVTKLIFFIAALSFPGHFLILAHEFCFENLSIHG